MAAKTPAVFSATTDGSTFMNDRSIRIAVGLTDERTIQKEGLTWITRYFADIDDGDTYASGIPGIVLTAWQDEDPANDTASARVTTQATGVVTFQTGAANGSGWLHLWRQ